jgi:rhodanese-related sulfurtransferase
MFESIPKEIGREDVRLLVRRGAQLVEALPQEDYEALHLPGAINIPLSMFSRKTADRLKWDKPVVVYSRSSLCDLSARAAWRLASLGFTQVFRYTGGKADWIANGFPMEGSQARTPGAGDLADLDVPTCLRSERVGQVRERVRKDGWDACVVVNDQLVVLGMLRANDLAHADQQWPAEEAMDRDPRTFRLNTPPEEVKVYFEKNLVADAVLITTPDGKLFGLVKRAQVA